MSCAGERRSLALYSSADFLIVAVEKQLSVLRKSILASSKLYNVATSAVSAATTVPDLEARCMEAKLHIDAAIAAFGKYRELLSTLDADVLVRLVEQSNLFRGVAGEDVAQVVKERVKYLEKWADKSWKTMEPDKTRRDMLVWVQKKKEILEAKAMGRGAEREVKSGPSPVKVAQKFRPLSRDTSRDDDRMVPYHDGAV